MNRYNPTTGIKSKWAIALALTTLATGLLTTACEETPRTGTNNPSPGTNTATTNSPTSTSTAASGNGLRIGSLLPATGDLSSVGQPLPQVIRLAIDTVNNCGGVNGAPVTLISEDDQTQPEAGTTAMTKLVEVDKVAGVVGSFASSVSSAAVPIAVRNKVMLISPGSTSPVFTQNASKYDGFWARTAPPDTYQAQALAKLASQRGLKTAATIAINNDYGVGFEKEFVKAFKQLGGTVTNESKPTRYDAKAATFESETAAALAGKPKALAAVLYAETGSLLLKSAYQQGLTQGTTIMLTDGVYSADFPEQVGKTSDGKYILAGAIGTVPGANGPALAEFTKFWKQKSGRELTAYVPHAWDAAALLMLAAQAAKSNTGEGIKSKIRDVANAPGVEVSDVCKALDLVKKGQDINFQGASGNVDIDANGDVVGSYDVWTVKDDGKLAVIGKVSPK